MCHPPRSMCRAARNFRLRGICAGVNAPWIGAASRGARVVWMPNSPAMASSRARVNGSWAIILAHGDVEKFDPHPFSMGMDFSCACFHAQMCGTQRSRAQNQAPGQRRAECGKWVTGQAPMQQRMNDAKKQQGLCDSLVALGHSHVA